MASRKRKPGEPPRNGTELQRDLLVAGKAYGWLVQMTRRSQMCRTESSSGFPDLMMAKGGRFLFIECKSKYEQLSPEQELWFAAIAGWPFDRSVKGVVSRYAGSEGTMDVAWFVFRPADFERAIAVIREDEGTWQ